MYDDLDDILSALEDVENALAKMGNKERNDKKRECMDTVQGLVSDAICEIQQLQEEE